LSWDTALLVVTTLIVAYTWLGYAGLLWALRLCFGRAVVGDATAAKPFVSIIVPVHNEEERVAAKLQNCLDLRYPRDRLEILVASDGSTDRTEAVVKEFAARDARIRLLPGAGRMGKSATQNLAAQQAKGEILFLTDTETRAQPDVLERMVSNFADAKVGLVTASVHLTEPATAIAKGQGLYWRYELFLRQAESDLGTLATSSGQALAIRRELFVPMEECYGDDCILPLDVRLQGYRVIQDQRAVVFDGFPHSLQGELRARTRMVARNWTGTLSRPAILNPWRFPGTAWGLVSHKFLRWLTPFLLGVLLLVSTLASLYGRYVSLLFFQAAFYAAAMAGWLRIRAGRQTRVFALPFAFCLANWGFLLGTMRALRGQRVVAYTNQPTIEPVVPE
jgi:cellulose synthase/poly-beta-1,6-N-acetylglucosamine synthase-like glycosyltransferase